MKLIKKTTLVCILVAAALMVPVGNASDPRIVYNYFDEWYPTDRVLPNGNIITDFVSVQTWGGGGWEGTAVQEGKMITFAKTGTQIGSAKGVFTGTIDGKSGTVKYRLWQIIPSGDPTQFVGSMLIIKGTGELRGIKGYGNLVFVMPTPYTEIYMRFR